jgi:hypothetical protein
VEVRWQSLFRSTSLGKGYTSYNAPPTSRKRAAGLRWSLRNFLPRSSLFMVGRAQKSHGVRSELSSVFSFKKTDRWNPIRTSAMQSRFRSMRFLGFSNHETGTPRQEISKWSTVYSTYYIHFWKPGVVVTQKKIILIYSICVDFMSLLPRSYFWEHYLSKLLYEHGSDSHRLRRYGCLKCSLTWNLFNGKRILQFSVINVQNGRRRGCRSWHSTVESVTLRRTATSLTRLAASKIYWSSSCLVSFLRPYTMFFV